MIYIASPYTADPELMGERAAKARAFVAYLARTGSHPYSPIVHFHSVAVAHRLPHEFEFWRDINFNMIKRADQLFVLRLKGWEESKGVTAEIIYAHQLDLPVHHWHETRYATFERVNG